MNKLTNKTTLEILREVDLTTVDLKGFAPADILGKVDSMIAQLDKKNGADRKPTKAQLENELLKESILAALTTTPVSITELQKTNAGMGEMSNQKLSSLIRQLVNEGKVLRDTVKRVAVFSIEE